VRIGRSQELSRVRLYQRLARERHSQKCLGVSLIHRILADRERKLSNPVQLEGLFDGATGTNTVAIHA